MSSANPETAVLWVPVVNSESSLEAPAFGLLEPTGTIDTDGRIQVRRPTSDGNTAVYVNGPSPIPAGKAGQATRILGPRPVHYDTAGTPAALEMWGSKASSWKLTEGETGFRIIGAADATSATVIADRQGSGAFTIECDEATGLPVVVWS